MTSVVPEARSTLADFADETSSIISPPLASARATIKKTIYPANHPVGQLSSSASFNRVLSLAPDTLLPSSWADAQTSFQVLGLNHFNITASPPVIEQVKRFYIDIVGLKIGNRAHLNHNGYWLYAGTSPILHLSARPEIETVVSYQQGSFNHISLGCVGLKRAIAKLTSARVQYRLIELLDIKQTQLFLTDPAGIGVELTFFDECL